jgi:hypothetical protein
VAERERAGEDTSFAYGVLAKRAAKDGRIKEAYGFLAKTREFIMKETEEAVLVEEMEHIGLMASSGRDRVPFAVYLPAPGARERTAAAGLSKEFERALRSRNVANWHLMAKWLDESSGDFEALGREVQVALGMKEGGE